MKTHSLSSHPWMNGSPLLKASAIVLLCGLPAEAYLGNFEQAAGYIPIMSAALPSANVAGDWQNGTGFVHSPFGFNPGPPAVYGRVTPDFTRYNAGQPGGFVDIKDDTGLWVAASGSAGRPESDVANGGEQFIAIHDGAGRPVGDQNVMCVRTSGSTNPLDYRYTLDAQDLAGTNPATLTDATYTFTFDYCPLRGPAGNIGLLGFTDDLLNTALQIGTDGNGMFQYRSGSAGALTTTGTQIGATGWSRVTVVINTATDRANIDVRPWDDVTNSLGATVSIVNNFASANLSKITKLNFRQVANVEKYFYDGFVMSASGGSPSCSITSINVTPGACNDNGTPNNATEDYYTASVTVNYTNPPATGNLVISGPALHSTNSVTTVAVGSLNSSTSHTFVGVRLVAQNASPMLTANFQ